MRPRTSEEMDGIMRMLANDCLDLMKQAGLRQSDLATLLGTSRVTISKMSRHLEAGGTPETLPISGQSAATMFMNLLIVRRLLELDLASGALPVESGASARRWVRSHMEDPTR